MFEYKPSFVDSNPRGAGVEVCQIQPAGHNLGLAVGRVQGFQEPIEQGQIIRQRCLARIAGFHGRAPDVLSRADMHRHAIAEGAVAAPCREHLIRHRIVHDADLGGAAGEC